VADPANQDRQTETLRALNAKLHADQRISLSLVPIGDGLTIALKRPAR
jgi:caffeoyl-CoA O-methyltransferase